ncbi:MAG: PadR family transcriptional regulator [Actinobacteria bacterium]|nr:MAG: PadR family transcriptional regulator [Actinomycetota bacterium]
MSLEHAILGFLAGGPMTGYDLKTRGFDRTASHVWTADQAQVYRTLDRLVKRRLATSRAVPQRGKPDRRLYSITPRGREELATWLAAHEELPPYRDPFLLRMLFASDLSDADLLRLLAETRDDYMRRLEQIRTRLAATPERNREDAVRRMTLEASAAAARSAIDWIDACADRVRSGLPAPALPGMGGAG